MRCPTMRPTATLGRRGLTLVELLVSIALMLLVMSIIVAVFTAATGAMTAAQRDQELGSVARRLEGVIQQDLRGATARFTPPLNPQDNLGYFELGENSFDDLQGEDTDDYLAFTVRAPVGQPFTGRVMLPRGVWPAGVPLAGQTRYAPATITSDTAEVIYFLRHGNLYRRVLLVVPNQQVYADIIPGNPDQFRFAGVGSDGFSLSGANQPEVSWQGANDISVRPSNSIAALNDSPPIPNSLGDLTNRHNRFARPGFANDLYQDPPLAFAQGPDGTIDDINGDGVPDYYPTLYPNVFGRGYVNEVGGNYRSNLANTPDVLPFPFLFPTPYSDPLPNANRPLGRIHEGPDMSYTNSVDGSTRTVRNHSPLQTGDNLVGDSAAPEINWSPTNSGWTFWGFPTWAETRNIRWTAANKRIGFQEFGRNFGFQPYGLSWRAALGGSPDWLPVQSHWYSDGIGNNTLSPDESWQDDLIATNVRSFDVKVLDPNALWYSSVAGQNRTPDYYDLGYASRLNGTSADEVQTLGHEGRIPPLVADNRFDYQMQRKFGIPVPIGDNTPSTLRLRRVWDTWSTDYAFAPFKGLDPTIYPPLRSTRPLYPSYPPPYPEPLRGIQIQIRLATPDDTQLKVLTIRQDFTDKL